MQELLDIAEELNGEIVTDLEGELVEAHFSSQQQAIDSFIAICSNVEEIDKDTCKKAGLPNTTTAFRSSIFGTNVIATIDKNGLIEVIKNTEATKAIASHKPSTNVLKNTLNRVIAGRLTDNL